MKYLVTGATGHLGSKILAEIRRLIPDKEIVAGVHTPSKADDLRRQGLQVVQVDYFNRDSLVNALKGIDVFVYVPSKSYDSFTRITELEYVIEAAKKSRVGHILAMSFIADQVDDPFSLSAFYGYLPRRLAESGVPYTIIRNSLYADPLVSYLPELIELKNVIYPMGNKALSFISLEDSAKAFAKVATTRRLRQNGKIYTLTQGRNYTMPELAEVLTEVAGHRIGYQPVSLDEFGSIYDDNGEGHMLSSMYCAGSLGMLQELSNDYKTIMDHEATPLIKFLKSRLS
ncbi:SDR family oxidoreductase [Companilactobacillus keshanensis]|uniref:SDR family oxidoreductase n=1 Tax=Companilactobacillus keshanensis TaxID=2486003 RepID=A0ABW4BVT9_9LACO|nr:SDR family oxidoreductase [Companilactobacillus keshanensis]